MDVSSWKNCTAITTSVGCRYHLMLPLVMRSLRKCNNNHNSNKKTATDWGHHPQKHSLNWVFLLIAFLFCWYSILNNIRWYWFTIVFILRSVIHLHHAPFYYLRSVVFKLQKIPTLYCKSSSQLMWYTCLTTTLRMCGNSQVTSQHLERSKCLQFGFTIREPADLIFSSGKIPQLRTDPLKGRLTLELLHCVCISDEQRVQWDVDTLKSEAAPQSKKRRMDVFSSFSHCADKRFSFMWNPKKCHLVTHNHTNLGPQVNITHWIQHWPMFCTI